jgi:hypothetical protein
MTQLHDLAARFARGLLSNFLTLQSEGAGNAGCTLHPRSRVQYVDRGAHEHTGQRRHPTFPAQWLYGLYRALPGRAGLVVTVAREKLASHELDASIGASGPHDFAVRDQHRRRRAAFAHEPKPALRKRVAHPALPRPPLPAPYVRDDRDTPLLWARDGGSCRVDLGRTRSGIFFARGLDRF